jgi:predicted dehydrogenase
MAADFANRSLTVIARDRGRPVPGVAGFGMEEVAWQDHDALAAEHAAFAAAVLDGAPVLVDAAAGRRALAAALAVTDSMAAARARMVASGLIEQGQNGGGGGV